MASRSFRRAALARRAAPQLLALTPAALRTTSRLPAASLARSASSFIARAKESGPEGLLGNFTSAGTFDRCLEEAEPACICVDDDGERTVCVRVPQRGMWMQRFEPGPWLGEISDQLV